jgi:ectoine hydroxylase-related dioxygenase (phytanoyl-CoA dioxygenase family)
MAADTENYRTGPLREDEVERYRKDGFLLAGKVISDSTTEKLRAALDRLAGAPVPDGTASFDLAKRDERTKDYELGFITFLWKTQPEFREVAFSPYLARMAAQLLGTDKVVLFGDSSFVKPPRKGGKLYWHQDCMAWPLDKPGGLTCWIALDEATPENGSMVFAPGSQLLGERLPVDSLTGDVLKHAYVGGDRKDGRTGRDLSKSGMLPITSPQQEGLPEVPTYYQPGECSFHDTVVWHASGYNTSDKPRRAYSIRYADGHRLWLGEQKAFYNFTDEEAGIEVGTPVGGPNFPTVWPPAED